MKIFGKILLWFNILFIIDVVVHHEFIIQTMQLKQILPFPVFSLEIDNYGHLFVTFYCCERSKLKIVMNVLHRINKVLLIFRLYFSELQVEKKNISSYVSYYCVLFGKPGQC